MRQADQSRDTTNAEPIDYKVLSTQMDRSRHPHPGFDQRLTGLEAIQPNTETRTMRLPHTECIRDRHTEPDIHAHSRHR
jgi:hypothetical protein